MDNLGNWQYMLCWQQYLEAFFQDQKKALILALLSIFCLSLSHSIFSVAYNVFTAITNQKTVEDV
ncbi:MAG: hypothetical protein ACI965_001563 [Paraglaciecola sp.]|jgi:hypothetical protein